MCYRVCVCMSFLCLGMCSYRCVCMRVVVYDCVCVHRYVSDCVCMCKFVHECVWLLVLRMLAYVCVRLDAFVYVSKCL